MRSNLHIITFNIPCPADYGGIIDSFYRIRALHSAGINVHLHCFEYGRRHAPELESICASVMYYERNTSFIKHFSALPFTVNSRNSDQLRKDLLNDDYPILFDGLHSTFLMDHDSLRTRKKFVRLHNIEHSYYSTLSKYERNPVRKLYYSIESLKLKHYEKILHNADGLLAISETDHEYFESKYHTAELIPPFHPFDEVSCSEGNGDYIIYHGDLSVNENAIVAEYLCKKIFSQLSHKCVIAGKNPPPRLSESAADLKNISIISNPDSAKMTDLIRNAQVNLLFSMAANGMKLKLLMALFAGRHCIANTNIIEGTLLGPACHVENSAEGIIKKINELMNLPFNSQMINERRNKLEMYSNSFNAGRLIRIIFPV